MLHVVYKEQLKLKEDYLNKLFAQVNYQHKIQVVDNKEPLHYRHKVVLSATTIKNKLRLGLYREKNERSHSILKVFSS